MEYDGESELVMLGECDSEQELMVVRGLLESEGIECFSPKLEWTSHIDKSGSFPLQVRQQDLAKARALLDATIEPTTDDDNQS